MSTACCLKRQRANEQAVATAAAYPHFCVSVEGWQVSGGVRIPYKRILADALADNQRLGHLPVLRPGGLDL
jgi:hypothetical protein